MNHRGRRPRPWAAVSLLLLGAAACRDLDPVRQPAHTLPHAHGQVASGTSAALTSSLSPSVQFNLYSPPNMAIAYGVNDAGLVVGEFGGNNIASVWSQATGTIVVGRTDATTDCCSSFASVNNLGQAVGFSHSNTYAVVPTRWSLATGDQALLVFGRDYAEGINDNGDIVGMSPIAPNTPWFMTADGSYSLLQYAAPASGANARGVNNNRVIVGESDIPGNSGGHALLWSSPASVAIDLGTLGGARSAAWYVNSSGDIVGWSEVANGDHHAFLWTAQTGMIDLGALPNACPGTSEAYAVNDLGVIAGECNNAPVLWTAVEGMRYLPMPAGVTAGQARAINNHNTVAGAYNGRGSGAVWTISNQPPVANVGGPYTGAEGSAVAFDGSASSDPDADALSYAWDFGDGSTGTGVAPTHSYADNGSYTVSLIVTDSKGAPSPPVTTTATIANVAPTVGAVSGPSTPVAVNTAVSVGANFTDPGALDTHTASIDWGDGSTSTPTVGGSNTAGTVSGTHAYGAAGVYTVQVTVTDKDGGSSGASFQYAVVYDVSAGFVTGGGWINSPAGAYAASASVTGKATFGFVSRYLPGAQTPSGNTEFEFRAGSLRFSSTSYQWLVVSGARAQYKGSGNLNGQSGYGFILTAVDGDLLGSGQPDQFRIKITDANGGVVYDNQVGGSDTDPLAGTGTLLGGGGIQIHH